MSFPNNQCFTLFRLDQIYNIMDKRLLDIFDLIELSNPDICIVVTDKNLEIPGPKILYVNNKWEEITGYTKEEAVGKTPRFLQGPNSSRETLNKLKECLKNGEKFEGTSINYTKDGHEVNMAWLAIQPIFGHFVAIQKVCEDKDKILAQLKEVEIKLVERLKEYQ